MVTEMPEPRAAPCSGVRTFAENPAGRVVYAELLSLYNALEGQEREGAKGAQLKGHDGHPPPWRVDLLKYKRPVF